MAVTPKKRTAAKLVASQKTPQTIYPLSSAGQNATQGGTSGQGHQSAANYPSSTGTPGGMGDLRASTPFGRYFTPGTQAAAWQDPQALTTAYFKFNQLPKLGGGYAMALDDSQRAGLLYMLLNNNAPGGIEQYGNAGPLDWFGKYEANQFRPGGAAVGPQDIARALFDAHKGTPVYDALNGTQTPQEQVSNWINTLTSGLKGTMPDPVYQSLVARYEQAGRDFAAQRLHNPLGATTFGQYLDQQGLGASRYGA